MYEQFPKHIKMIIVSKHKNIDSISTQNQPQYQVLYAQVVYQSLVQQSQR
jgi:hypothetical protein